MSGRRRVLLLGLVLLAVTAAACGPDGGGEATGRGGSASGDGDGGTRLEGAENGTSVPTPNPADAPPPPARGEITVFAAASLTDAFTEMGGVFSRANPGAVVRFNFGPSSGLATQIDQGAPADVFAPADERIMGEVVKAGAVTDAPSTFAHNSLEIAVPAGNPGGVRGLPDLAREELFIGLCAEQVPCGRLARQLLQQAGVAAVPDTNEADVRALLTKIEAGELDAGLVYRTDVKVAGERVVGIETGEDPQVVTTYPIAPVAASANPELAQAYVDFVLSPAGQQILAGYGFLGG